MHQEPEVAVLGTCNMDIISRVYRFAGADEEINVDEYHQSVGGSAANCAVTLAQLGIRTGIMSRVGKDFWGDAIHDKLTLNGVLTERLITLDVPTGMSFLAVDDEGERSIYTHMGANAQFELSSEDINYIKNSKALHLTGMYVEVVEEASKHAKFLSFNPGMLLSSFGLDKLRKTIKRAHLLFLNQKEATVLTGVGPEEAADLLLEMVPVVIVTKGKEGADVYTDDRTITSSAKKTEVLDSTGAGDTFAAGFLERYLQNKDFKECLDQAHQVASRQVERWGGFD
ncbi:MAG TPA: carbohydrate kinase family protein [Methanobacteriaceae archaeon]|nr:carbohydrate kinase family protein [Methanobacteriaceae archaeon]